MKEKKVKPIIWLITFFILLSLLAFVSEAAPMNDYKENYDAKTN